MSDNRWFAYRSFWPIEEVVADFGRRGVETICFYPANTLNSLGVPYSTAPAHWKHLGLYDWPALDRQFDELLTANPRAKLLCMIDLNTPDWYCRFTRLFNDSFYGLGKVAADERWRKDTGDYLRAFLEHVEPKYGDRIAGYILSCGSTSEWLDLSQGEESGSRRQAWRDWCRARGKPDPLDLPAASVRSHVSHDLLRDPQADATGIDYWRFSHWLVAESILHFARATQEIIQHRVPLGVFFGYVFELTARNLLSWGHFDYDRVFASPELDFFIAPATYQDRQMGGASGFMQTIGSLQHHGKGYIFELDHRTHTANRNPLSRHGIEWGTGLNFWPDETASIAGLRREFCLALIEGVSLWWFDMWNHWYDSEKVRDAIEQMQKLWRRLAPLPSEPAAEVAVIVDAESCLYLDESSPRVNEFLFELRPPLGRIGAPYRAFSFADLPRLDLSAYKLLIFPNLFVVDEEKRRILDEYALRDGRTALWFYRPGVIADGRYDPQNVERLTGLPMSGEGLQFKAMPGWTSALSPTPKLSAAELRAVADRAGVHAYGAVGEPVFANRRLLAAHTATGGRRRLVLPRTVGCVRELFRDQVIARNVAEFEIELSAPDTALFELED